MSVEVEQQSFMTPERLSFINALLIALVTLIGAFVAWRASVAGDNAGGANLDGLIATQNYEEAKALNFAQLYENYRAYTAYTRYNELGNQLERDLVTAPTEAVELLDRQMREAWDAAGSFSFPYQYLRPDGSYDTERELGEALAEEARQRDLNAQPHFAEADKMQAKSNWLIVVITVLAVALLCLTLVESVSQSGLKFTLLGLGVVIMLGGVAATIVIEYFLFV
jgi:hypothetical protein